MPLKAAPLTVTTDPPLVGTTLGCTDETEGGGTNVTEVSPENAMVWEWGAVSEMTMDVDVTESSDGIEHEYPLLEGEAPTTSVEAWCPLVS